LWKTENYDSSEMIKYEHVYDWNDEVVLLEVVPRNRNMCSNQYKITKMGEKLTKRMAPVLNDPNDSISIPCQI